MIERPDFESTWTEARCDSLSLLIHSLCSREEPGGGWPVIFVPGLGVSAPSMLPTARLLTGERQVFAVDLPGHGKSERPSSPLDLEAYAEVLAAWLKALDFERAVWVGHSFGAQVLVELAIERPDIVGRLVLVSLTVDPEARTMASQLARLLLDATREPPALLRLLARDYLRTGFRTMLRNGRLAICDQVEKKLSSIQAPTLLVCGARDPLVPERWAEQMARLVPLAKLVVIQGAPHAVQYASPVDVARNVQEFLREAPIAPLVESTPSDPTNDSARLAR